MSISIFISTVVVISTLILIGDTLIIFICWSAGKIKRGAVLLYTIVWNKIYKIISGDTENEN